jgi:hypothetical protein
MYYLRTFPADFGLWIKRDKTSDEEKRFRPSEMMKRFGAPEQERLIYSHLAEAAHPNPTALSRIAGYDPVSDTLEISVGQVLSAQEASSLSADICLFGAISAYTTARTVKDALVDGLPNEAQLSEFLQRLSGLTDSLRRDRREGGTVFDLFGKRVRR